jgi:hypothetical protein
MRIVLLKYRTSFGAMLCWRGTSRSTEEQKMSVSSGPGFRPDQQRVNSMTGSGTNMLWRTARLLMLPAVVIVLDAFFATRMPAQTDSWAANVYPTRLPVAGAHFNSGPEFGQFGDHQIRSVQAALRRIGIYSGQVDGTLGPDTQRAIEQYQVREKRPVTGLPDRWLNASLGVSKAR